jgi:hypothetical protein
MAKRINGIQQLGVGVTNTNEGFRWFATYFGMDIKMFEEAAISEFMLPHTGGIPRPRHAILALNLQGGGGFEIWQHTGKKPDTMQFDIQVGDLGICIGKLKTSDIRKAYDQFKKWDLNILTQIGKDPSGNEHFFLKDVFENIWEIVFDTYMLIKTKSITGGAFGAVIGVKNIEESLPVYKDILGYDKLVYDVQGVFSDWEGLPGHKNTYHRLLLHHNLQNSGSFSPLFGPSSIELVQVLDRTPRNIYENRIWGDPGFIQLCFDVNGMDELRQEVKDKGFPFTVDSAKSTSSFDMGEAAGSFSYIQAPEGTLIEFVETHKIPLIKKLGWYLNLTKRKEKPLPKWIFYLFRFMRVRF